MNSLRTKASAAAALTGLMLSVPVSALGQAERDRDEPNAASQLQDAYPLDQPADTAPPGASSPQRAPQTTDSIQRQPPAGGGEGDSWSPALWAAIGLEAALALYLFARGVSAVRRRAAARRAEKRALRTELMYGSRLGEGDKSAPVSDRGYGSRRRQREERASATDPGDGPGFRQAEERASVTDLVYGSGLRLAKEPRARHVVSPLTLWLVRPLFRYCGIRRAYVLRLVGNRFGPVLRPRVRARHHVSHARSRSRRRRRGRRHRLKRPQRSPRAGR